ncbi:MAG: peptidylprolyl isomerase [Pseudoflavonifractor sp.]|nr:peptidylprolyl isomerase [Pseudoflavonifractor sp.]
MRTCLMLMVSVLMALTSCVGETTRAAAPQKTTETKIIPKMENKDTADVLVDITTTLGNIRVRLFGDTPRHRDNFVKLVNEGTYNGTLFHRVINDFMIQAGDPDSKNAPAGKMLGSGDVGYQIDAEIVYPRHFHKRGAIAAARTGDQINPEKRSSGCQFYIVTGTKFNDGQLDQMERQLQHKQMQAIFDRLAREHRDSIMTMRRNRDQAGLSALQEQLVKQTEAEAAKAPAKFTHEQREAYTTVGGAPHLDGDYTVYGEVVSGMDVVDKIERVQTDGNDRPKEDVRIISMKIVK